MRISKSSTVLFLRLLTYLVKFLSDLNVCTVLGTKLLHKVKCSLGIHKAYQICLTSNSLQATPMLKHMYDTGVNTCRYERELIICSFIAISAGFPEGKKLEKEVDCNNINLQCLHCTFTLWRCKQPKCKVLTCNFKLISSEPSIYCRTRPCTFQLMSQLIHLCRRE